MSKKSELEKKIAANRKICEIVDQEVESLSIRLSSLSMTSSLSGLPDDIASKWSSISKQVLELKDAFFDEMDKQYDTFVNILDDLEESEDYDLVIDDDYDELDDEDDEPDWLN